LLAEHELTLSVAEGLQRYGPWGQHFPEPVFDGTFDVISQRLVAEKHLKLVLAVNDAQFDAIAFNVDTAIWPNEAVKTVAAVFKLDVNEYRGDRRLQLVIEHLWADNVPSYT
jgi:single-stranded-DNA-specific exonuclease